MSLSLSLAFLEQNDNLALQVTDDVGTYHAVDNATGWGAPNPAVTDIVADADKTTPAKYHLLLDVTYTGSDAVSTIYDQLNLYDVNGGAFVDAGDLVWLLDAADLVATDGSGAMGTDEDELLDGKYDFVYQLVSNSNHASVTSTDSTSILLDGKVRVKIYDQLRQISTIYDSTEETIPIYHPNFREILVTELKKGLFDSMIANVSFANSDNVLSHRIRGKKAAFVSDSLKQSGNYRSDQGAIWSEIQEMSLNAKVHSSTGAMKDVYEGKKVDLEEYMKAFKWLPQQKGMFVEQIDIDGFYQLQTSDFPNPECLRYRTG